MKRQKSILGSFLFNIVVLLSFGIVLFLITNKDQEGTPVSAKGEKEQKKPTVRKVVKEEEPRTVQDTAGLNDRQVVILQYISEAGEVTPKQLGTLVKEVSSRTLRRDMDKLVEKGLVSQQGSTKSTFYRYIG